MSTDRIEKQVLLKASRERIWRALTDSGEFGHWFGARFDGPFASGQRVRARIVGTAVDPEVARMQAPWEGVEFDVVVEALEPMHRFAFRWHPGAAGDGGDDEMTLVSFTLEDAAGGILLRVVESGFDRLPPERRAKVFAENEGGWDMQVRLIAAHLAADAG